MHASVDQHTVQFRQPLACDNARLLLYAIRRMAAGGLNDAYAANALMTTFGQSFRRPLLLLRAFMAEMARVSQRAVVVAPCCCARTTRDEVQILRIIASAGDHPRLAHGRLTLLLGTDASLGALPSAAAVGQAFTDLGRPVSSQLMASSPAFPID